MKKKIRNILQYPIFLAIGIFLFWMVYKDIDITDSLNNLKKIKYKWIFLSVVIGILSHVVRALRWNLLIEPLGKRPRHINSLLAIMIGYFANLALPRMGEITRCGILKKYEKISFTKLVGTVAIERIVDLIILLLFTLFAFVTQFNIILKFLNHNPEIIENSQKIINYKIIIPALILISILGFVLIRKTKYREKIRGTIKKLLEGVKTIKKVKNKPLFIAHSFFVWILYFISFYFILLSFEELVNIPILAALMVFVMASCGMVVPVQGGIGAWHFMVMTTLVIYLQHLDNGNDISRLFAFVSHTIMTLIAIVFGFLSLIFLPIYNKKRKHIPSSLKNDQSY